MPRRLFPIFLAAALAACSGDDSAQNRSAITGDDVFLELIEEARIAMQDGDLARAGRLYDEALAIDRQSAGLWVDIARLRFRGGEHLAAIEAADFALELDPQFAPALLMRAQLVRDAHGLADALVWYEAAASADPRNPEVLADYAATLGDLGRYSEMLRVVRELAEFAPQYPQVHFLQAVLAARGDDPVLASNLLARSGLSDRGVPAALILDAIVDLQQGNFDTASETLMRLSDMQPGNVRVQQLLARALWLSGRDRELVDRFSGTINAPGASPYLMMFVGRSLERMGERDRALPLIARAREARQNGMIVLEGSGGEVSLPQTTAELRDFARTGNSGAAQRIAEAVLGQYPQSADINALAGDAALLARNPQQALARYEVASRVRRPWPLTRRIMEAYRSFGDSDAADALLIRSIGGDPHNIEALLLYAQASARDEDWLRVAVLLDTAIALGAASDLEVLALRSEAARALGDEQEAASFAALRRQMAPGSFTRN